MTPEISVIMSAYNSEATLQAAIDSILSQRFTNFEFLIVEDGSTDRTKEMIRRLTDPRVVLIENEQNIGLTRSLNKAIATSKGAFIARQDADDISIPDRLGKQISFMEAHPDVDLLGTTRGTLDDNGKIISTISLPEVPGHADFLKRNCLVHGSVMIRRKVLEKAGGYNELFRFSQDYELWLRISKEHRVMNLQEPLYCVRRHGNRVTLKKMAQAGLFRMLALNLAKKEVTPAALDDVQKNGIDAYYSHLNRQDKLKYHRSAKNRSIKYKSYQDAEHHLKKLIALCPGSLKLQMELARVTIAQCIKGSR